MAQSNSLLKFFTENNLSVSFSGKFMANGDGMNPKFTPETYALFARPFAQVVFDQLKIPIILAITQSAHESGNGNSQLSSDDNNYFGMTVGSHWEGDTVSYPSTEYSSLPPEKIRYWNRPNDIIEKKPGANGGSILKIYIDFRKYSSPLASFMDWGQHIKEIYPLAYAAAMNNDINGFFQEVGKKYGTDGRYSQSCLALVSTFQPYV